MGLGFGGERHELAYEKRAVLPEAAHQFLFPACQFFHHTGFGFCYPPCSDRPTGLTGTKVTKKILFATILNSFLTIFFSFRKKNSGNTGRKRSRERAGRAGIGKVGEVGESWESWERRFYRPAGMEGPGKPGGGRQKSPGYFSRGIWIRVPTGINPRRGTCALRKQRAASPRAWRSKAW